MYGNAAGMRLLMAVLLLALAERMEVGGEEGETTRAGVVFIAWVTTCFFFLDLVADLHNKGVL